MMRRIYLLAVLVMGCVTLFQPPAYAVTGVHARNLTLDSWPVLLAGLAGFGATHLTELLTNYNAPQWVKSGVNLVLVSLAGVLVTLTVVPGKTWKDYVGEIFMALVSSLVTHSTGITTWLQNATADVGIGGNVRAIAPPPKVRSSRARERRAGSRAA
jgi:hypothetical protein